MKISYNWLKEYVDIKLTAEKLAEVLTMAGLSVESISGSNGDYILELEITANRPDWLSVLGVAREVAALTGSTFKDRPSGARRPAGIDSAAKKRATVSVKIVDKELCPRYTARVIRNIKIAQSPSWLKDRIEAMGLRSVNNVVDITNYCLFETGEPMHAFDLDRLSGHGVVVRRSRKGEKIVVIDGSEKILDESTLVIADDQRPVAIAGIMGGLNTEVTASTKNILLEAAYFDPVSIRRTARKLGISTDSSYRFERRVDIENIVSSSDRAARLIKELAGGEPGELIDVKVPAKKPGAVTLRYGRLHKVLGLGIPPARIKNTTDALGMKTVSSSKTAIKLMPPSFRYDIKSEIDVIEEVARVYGYDNIPSTLPGVVDQPVRLEPDMALSRRLRALLTGFGLDEIMTYSLLSRKAVSSSGVDADSAIEIKNPLTSEQEMMRPSLIPGMLNAILWNMNRKAGTLKLFELGSVYSKNSQGLFCEKKHLCIGITGAAFESWGGSSRQADLFELKGIFESALAGLGVKDASFVHTKGRNFTPSACARIDIAAQTIGILGEVDRKTLGNFDIREKVYVLEADAGALMRLAETERMFSGLPKYPSICRDISIITGKDIANSDIMKTIKAAAGATLKDAWLVDSFKGKQIPEGKISLTYRLEYQDPAKTLEDKDIAQIHDKVLRDLDEKLGAKLR